MIDLTVSQLISDIYQYFWTVKLFLFQFIHQPHEIIRNIIFHLFKVKFYIISVWTKNNPNTFNNLFPVPADAVAVRVSIGSPWGRRDLISPTAPHHFLKGSFLPLPLSPLKIISEKNISYYQKLGSINMCSGCHNVCHAERMEFHANI